MKNRNENSLSSFENNEKIITQTQRKKQDKMNNDFEASFQVTFLKNRNKKNLKRIRNDLKLFKHKKKPKTTQSQLKKCTGQRYQKLKSKKQKRLGNLFRQNTLEKIR